jgi:hypothetical protein
MSKDIHLNYELISATKLTFENQGGEKPTLQLYPWCQGSSIQPYYIRDKKFQTTLKYSAPLMIYSKSKRSTGCHVQKYSMRFKKSHLTFN